MRIEVCLEVVSHVSKARRGAPGAHKWGTHDVDRIEERSGRRWDLRSI